VADYGHSQIAALRHQNLSSFRRSSKKLFLIAVQSNTHPLNYYLLKLSAKDQEHKVFDQFRTLPKALFDTKTALRRKSLSFAIFESQLDPFQNKALYTRSPSPIPSHRSSSHGRSPQRLHRAHHQGDQGAGVALARRRRSVASAGSEKHLQSDRHQDPVPGHRPPRQPDVVRAADLGLDRHRLPGSYAACAGETCRLELAHQVLGRFGQ
jgi:hypothetical protein